MAAASATPDLADLVYDHMTEIAADSAVCGFTVYRGKGNRAAVTFGPGILDAYTRVLRWTLPAWAEKLRARGFTVEVKTRRDRGEKAVPQWLRITDWQQPESSAP